MLLRKSFDNRLFLVLGLALLALRGTLQAWLDRNGRTTDSTDFLMGMMLGVGVGILLLFVWKLGREKRGH